MNRVLSVTAAVGICAALFMSSPGHAQEQAAVAEKGGFAFAGNLGITKYFDEGPTGFGLDIFPGYRLNSMLTIESRLGYHTGSEGIVKFSTIPLMAGARVGFDAGPVRPFVGAHVGLQLSTVKADVDLGPLGGTSLSTSETDLSFDIGGGVELPVGPASVGVAAWYSQIFAENDAITYLHAGAHVSF